MEVSPMTQHTFEHGGMYDKNYKIDYDFSVNVNPMGMPKKVRDELIANISASEKYPNDSILELISGLSLHYNLPKEYFVIGNGASEIITLLVQALIPRCAMIPVPTFSGYKRALAARGCRIKEYALRSDNNFELTKDFLASLKRSGSVDVVFLCNPNNPTGSLISLELIRELADFCEKSGIYLIIDECFMEFVPDDSKTSAVSLIDNHPHLIVIDAFTKLYCLPGIRLGYCMCSNKHLLSELNLLKPEWNVSSYACIAGIASLSETVYVKSSIDLITAEKAYLSKELTDIGFTVYNSSTNFILARLPLSLRTGSGSYLNGKSLTDLLAQNEGILIRNCSNFSGLDNSYIRIAVRNHSDNEVLINALKKAQTGNIHM